MFTKSYNILLLLILFCNVATLDKYIFRPLEYPNREELEKLLSEDAFHITQMGGMQEAGAGTYDHNKVPGKYHCIVCDKVLFSSQHKIRSSGWTEFKDTYGRVATLESWPHRQQLFEAACVQCGAILGLFFEVDYTSTRKRFVINSAALQFYPGR